MMDGYEISPEELGILHNLHLDRLYIDYIPTIIASHDVTKVADVEYDKDVTIVMSNMVHFLNNTQEISSVKTSEVKLVNEFLSEIVVDYRLNKPTIDQLLEFLENKIFQFTGMSSYDILNFKETHRQNTSDIDIAEISIYAKSVYNYSNQYWNDYSQINTKLSGTDVASADLAGAILGMIMGSKGIAGLLSPILSKIAQDMEEQLVICMDGVEIWKCNPKWCSPLK